VGQTQPKGSVTSASAVAVTENQKTMAEVASVCTSLRTKTCASAAKTAPDSTSIAPKACAVSTRAPGTMVRRGESTMSTPIMPRITAEIRNSRTFSPRNMAAKTTVRRGAA
jgi:hypothetical protein